MSAWGLRALVGLAWLMFAVLIAVLWRLKRAGQRKSQALQTFARETGLSLEDEEEFSFEDEFTDDECEKLQLCNQGDDKDLNWMMRGSTKAGKVLLFYYSYEDTTRVSKETHFQTVAAFPRAGRDLPHFELRPERWSQKIAQAAGMKNMDFNSHSQFSKDWLLRGQDETAVRRLFSRDLLSFFETVDAREYWWVEGAGRWLLVWGDKKIIQPAELQMFVEQAAAIAGNFKDRARGRET